MNMNKAKSKFFLKEAIAATTNCESVANRLEEVVIFDISNIVVPPRTSPNKLGRELPVTSPYPNVWFYLGYDAALNGFTVMRHATLVTQTRTESGWKLQITPFNFVEGRGVEAYSSEMLLTLAEDGTVDEQGILSDGLMEMCFPNPVRSIGDPSVKPMSENALNGLVPKALLDPKAGKMVLEAVSQIIFYNLAIKTIFSLALLNTKNVEAVDVFPKTSHRKRNRHAASHFVPHHYTLHIRSGSRKSADDNQLSGAKNSFHFARGHFKTYTEESPLLGKHVGTYWWEAHARGSKTQGAITKDYEVHPLIETRENRDR